VKARRPGLGMAALLGWLVFRSVPDGSAGSAWA